MVTALVSTLALALAIGPHLQISLQVAPTETVVPVDPVAGPADNDIDLTVPSDRPVMDETPIMDDVQVDDVQVDDTAPELTGSDAPETAVAEDVPAAAPAQPVSSGAVDPAEWTGLLETASTALAAAKTAKGNFIQSNADGSVSQGSFALNRPGRIRFDYDDPTPILIVSDGTTVAMEDRDLETIDRIPLGSTPLGLILSTELDVDTDIEVLSIFRNASQVAIRMTDASGELEGTLTMVFDETTFDLLGWLAVDGNQQTTVVDLVNVETNVRIDPRLFRLDEDEDEEDER